VPLASNLFSVDFSGIVVCVVDSDSETIDLGLCKKQVHHWCHCVESINIGL